MKIISLNTWGGRAGHEELLAFFEREKESTDIFCLQEMWRAPYDDLHGKVVGGVVIKAQAIMTDGVQRISKTLNDYELYFHAGHGDNYGLTSFVKKNLIHTASGEVFVHKYKNWPIPEGQDVGLHARNMQYVTLSRIGRSEITVCHFHGLWNGKGKIDTPERLAQSEKILSFLKSLQGDVVLMGDFNLLPDTESVKMLENAGYGNLIKEYGITSTRTSFYTKDEKFADYAFISPGVEVTSFRVLQDEVSDHAALELIIK